MMGSLMVLASHAGDEILGAEQMMADAFAEGERVGIIVLAQSRSASIVPSGHRDARMKHTFDCQLALQALLGQVPPLLMLSYPMHGFALEDQPDLAQGSMLGGFLQSIGAQTLLVTDPGHSDQAYEAALGLASRIISAGLAQRLVVVPLGQAEHDICRHSAWEDEGIAGELSLIDVSTQQRIVYPIARVTADSSSRASSDKAARYTAIAAAMGDKWYPDILELGCAEGDLTPLLAAHCGHLLALDASQTALDFARLRAGGALNIEWRLSDWPNDIPLGAFDLIILNDFLGERELTALTALAKRLPSLCKEGCRIVIAIRQEGAGHVITAEVATALLLAELPGWAVVPCGTREQRRIHVLEQR
jgi:SAM-dependent methyltransferase